MKRTYILIGLLISVILCGCASGGQNVQLSREDYEKLLEMAERATEPDSTTTDKSTPTPTPTPTESPEETPDSEENEYVDVHFDVLDIDLPFPKWVEEWDNGYYAQEYGDISFDNGAGQSVTISAFLPDDGIDIMTGEPVSYDEYFFDDAGPEAIVDWSDVDNLFKIHASVNGLDTFMSVYHIPEYHYTIKMTCPTEMVEKYQTAFDHVCEAVKEVEPNPQVISEEDIIKYCQEKYQSPLVEIDRYEEGYKPIVHLYEYVEDGEESHTATWGWVKVDPVTGEATDEMTYETFIIPGSKIKSDKQ